MSAVFGAGWASAVGAATQPPGSWWLRLVAMILAFAGALSWVPRDAYGVGAEARSAIATPSANSERVAFVREGDIWVKHLPDGEERRLTKDGDNDSPRWSPSGAWLAFVKRTPDADRSTL